MREIIWVAAIVTVALLLMRQERAPSLAEAPDDPWFQTNVVGPSAQKPVIVKFGAEWCGPCRRMEGELDKLETRLPGRVSVVRVDFDERGDLAEHFGVRGIPDTVVFRDGKAVARDIGYLDADALERWIRPWLP